MAKYGNLNNRSVNRVKDIEGDDRIKNDYDKLFKEHNKLKYDYNKLLREKPEAKKMILYKKLNDNPKKESWRKSR